MTGAFMGTLMDWLAGSSVVSATLYGLEMVDLVVRVLAYAAVAYGAWQAGRWLKERWRVERGSRVRQELFQQATQKAATETSSGLGGLLPPERRRD